jgi:hypothetical protein
MNTTWKVMSQYVAVGRMAVFDNVEIPIAMAFGPAKIKELYEMFSAGFLELFQIHPLRYVLESGQRSSLEAIDDDHHPMRLLIYHRHFGSTFAII